MTETTGYIYILTNPAFPAFVKIGYAEDVDVRVKALNRSECIPYAFRVYATYAVPFKITDKRLYEIIDKLNPELRNVQNYNGRTREREFFDMSPEDAYSILEAIAEIHGTVDNLQKRAMTHDEQLDEESDYKVAKDFDKKNAENFTFSSCNIPVGERIEWYQDIDMTFRVVDDTHVEYEGDKMTLSGLAKRMLCKTGSLRGPLYFTYRGIPLLDIKKK